MFIKNKIFNALSKVKELSVTEIIVFGDDRRLVIRFISVDICSNGLNHLRNLDLVVKKIENFLGKNVNSKFRTTGN